MTRRTHREKKTVSIMIGMYCRERHRSRDELCEECVLLQRYAMQRIDKCPFCLDKPTCANCEVHCYRPDMRDRVRSVMRHSGPRMVLSHPWLALRHLLDGWRTAPALRRTAPESE